MASENALKAVTYRLTSTPTQSLPSILPALQNSLLNCKVFIQSPNAQAKNTSGFVVFDRFKKQLTSFLTDSKHLERRWAAVALIKCTVDIGGATVVHDAGLWIRGLLSVLGRWQDSPTTKKAVILALTKIFIITEDHPNLIRELTTPNLPQYVNACLQNINLTDGARVTPQHEKTRTALRPWVFESFSTLVVNHPTIFRTFEKQIRELLLPLIVPTPSSIIKHASNDNLVPMTNTDTQQSAQQLFTLLHFTAPKSGGPEQWNSTILHTISDTHATLDQVFRSVQEEWRTTTGVTSTIKGPHAYDNEPAQPTKDASKLGLPPWKGLYAGVERLTGLLSLLCTFLQTQTSGQINFPTGRIVDLLTRLLLTTQPDPSKKETNQDHNEACSREEREALFASLPSIHIAAFDLILALIDRFEKSLLPISLLLLDYAEFTLKREITHDQLRETGYHTIASLLAIIGRSLRTPRVRRLGDVILAACADIVPDPEPPSAPTKGITTNSVLATPTSKPPPPPDSPVTSAAGTFITACLTHLLPNQIPTALRTQLDRTAILSQNRDAMLASVINPPKSTSRSGGKVRSSILPFLARSAGADLDVEGLLRPRLPVVVDEVVVGEDGMADEGVGSDVDGDAVGNNVDEEGAGAVGPGAGDEGELDLSDAADDTLAMDVDASATAGQKRLGEAELSESLSKRVRYDSPTATGVVEPQDETVAPAPPAAIPVITHPETDDRIGGDEEVAVEPVSEALNTTASSLEEDITISRTREEKGKARAGEILVSVDEPRKEDNEDSDSLSGGSIPELHFKGSSSEEEDGGEEEEEEGG